MPLEPRDAAHREQIDAGITGRLRGHGFEKRLTAILNNLHCPLQIPAGVPENVVTGNPGNELIRFICQSEGIAVVSGIHAWWLGGLATAGEGDVVSGAASGESVRRSKTDVLIELTDDHGAVVRRGVSVKTCNKVTPTNDQLYCTTATGFCILLRRSGIPISEKAEAALKMFCGDEGCRPRDVLTADALSRRLSDYDRFFWEELPDDGRSELEEVLTNFQNQVTRILLQKAYPDDPYPPDYVFHQRVKFDDLDSCPIALFRIDKLIDFSSRHSGFATKPYQIRKGRHKGDPAVHLAPRFGFVQFQRLGNVQNATELQFNLKAGYFNELR